MIAVIDSGSTKSDWMILDNDYNLLSRISTIGLNPYFVDEATIKLELLQNENILEIKNNLNLVFFYGAGCSNDRSKKIVYDGLKSVLPNARIKVDHDLLAAAYAAYDGTPSVVCILGTGSNTCFFDGKTLRDDTHSLGFILGDEGSGNHFGKKLISGYVNNNLPKKLKDKFDEQFGLTPTEITNKLYLEPFPNRFLASFSRFVHANKDMPYIQNMIYKSLTSFMMNQVMVYPEALTTEINCIGSIAAYYENTLRDVAGELRIQVNQVIQKPIGRLVEYHKENREELSKF